MTDRPSSPNPRKQTDASSLLLELAKIFCLKKFSRALINNKPLLNNDIDDHYKLNIAHDLKSFHKYNFPSFNDEDFERLNLDHYLFRFQWQSNFSSPIEQNLLSGGLKVLDVGCGTGTWILDMAKEYHPTNIYIGIDILPILPDENSRLSNTGFIQCDLLDGIPFPDSTFDFVCERFLIYPDLTDSQWKYLFSEIKRVLKPGGYLEIMEYRIGYDNPGPITQNRNDQVFRYLNSKGIDPETTINSIPQMLQSSSFSDFHKQDKICPIGRWGGEIGLMMLNSYETSQKALNKRFQPGLTEEETDDIFASIASEFDEYKTQLVNFRCYARKN
ncbi:unnamed protein product [Rhizophagus irregularis]|uniref:S-adenosyl-L-methionine-dependent methyltransferase n=1 Tax=Rhizophagus irregularis TaxID=588596 RepID=A0A2N1N9I2_9GLOM|nr:S-adenosyl-L-methionine-dependent methyltransferase [Rhizophagus irregularis]CAB4377447.1 unnamed protein product [Rhizophagus irregularis]CAB5392055.1 unnamed protein product [Rhizophagus irregularis]